MNGHDYDGDGIANSFITLYPENGNVRIGEKNQITTPTAGSKLQISDGDVYIEDINKGVIMKSPNGQCWRMTVTNAGQAQFTSITCP